MSRRAAEEGNCLFSIKANDGKTFLVFPKDGIQEAQVDGTDPAKLRIYVSPKMPIQAMVSQLSPPSASGEPGKLISGLSAPTLEGTISEFAWVNQLDHASTLHANFSIGIEKSRTRAPSPIGEAKIDVGAPEGGLTSRERFAFSDSEDLSADEDRASTLTRSAESHIRLRATHVIYTPSSHAPAHAKRTQKLAAKATSSEPSILDFLSKQDKESPVKSASLHSEMEKLGYEPLAPGIERDGTLKFSNGTDPVATISEENGNYKIKIEKGPAIVAINLKNERGEETDQQIVISYNEKGEVDKIIPSEGVASKENGSLKTKDGLIIPLSGADYALMTSGAQAIYEKKFREEAQVPDVSPDASSASTSLSQSRRRPTKVIPREMSRDGDDPFSHTASESETETPRATKASRRRSPMPSTDSDLTDTDASVGPLARGRSVDVRPVQGPLTLHTTLPPSHPRAMHGNVVKEHETRQRTQSAMRYSVQKTSRQLPIWPPVQPDGPSTQHK